MSVTPIPLNRDLEVGKFIDFLYRDQTGFVYVPTKQPATEEWESNFFEWPRDRNAIVKHVVDSTVDREVYIGPALYKYKSARKEAVKGTYVLWTEFDGVLPTPDKMQEIPAPTLRILSSSEGHEHFYWSLNYFEVDVEAIERGNRGLCYTLEADASAWDATQILRPPSTINHKRGKPVVTLSVSETQHSVEIFSRIPDAPIYVKDHKTLSEIPDTLDVVAKYKWEAEAFDFFRNKEVPKGSRSSALMRLGYYCAEMYMTDEEAFSVLSNADARWGKFANRTDRDRRLLDIVNRARIKYPISSSPEGLSAEIEDNYEVFGFQQLLDADIEVEWLIEGLLQKNGYLLLSGPPGTGKTQLSLRFAINMALGKDFLDWSVGVPQKILFISMEMGHADIKYFLEQMAKDLTPEERVMLDENLLIMPLGFGVMLDKPGGQVRVREFVEKYQPTGVFFDSLGSTTTDELSSESTVKNIMDYVDRLRAKYNVFAWFIHHNRKAQSLNKKPNKLSDVYGSQYITARATTVLGLWANKPGSNAIEISGLKVRLAPGNWTIDVARTENLNFERMTGRGLIGEIHEKSDDESPTSPIFDI